MSEKKTYSASNIFRAEMGFGLDDMKAMGKPTPITPEKLRELAVRTYPFGLEVGDYVRACRETLRAAADEIERLQGLIRVIGMAEMDEDGKVTPVMVNTPNGQKPISETKDGDVYEGGIWSLEP